MKLDTLLRGGTMYVDMKSFIYVCKVALEGNRIATSMLSPEARKESEKRNVGYWKELKKLEEYVKIKEGR